MCPYCTGHPLTLLAPSVAPSLPAGYRLVMFRPKERSRPLGLAVDLRVDDLSNEGSLCFVRILQLGLLQPSTTRCSGRVLHSYPTVLHHFLHNSLDLSAFCSPTVPQRAAGTFRARL